MAQKDSRAYVYVTGANGLTARIPADRVKQWSAAQEKLRRGEEVPEARQMQEQLTSMLKKKYGAAQT